jgi:hypothetical protein
MKFCKDCKHSSFPLVGGPAKCIRPTLAVDLVNGSSFTKCDEERGSHTLVVVLTMKKRCGKRAIYFEPKDTKQ